MIKRAFITGIAALFLATGAAHATTRLFATLSAKAASAADVVMRSK